MRNFRRYILMAIICLLSTATAYGQRSSGTKIGFVTRPEDKQLLSGIKQAARGGEDSIGVLLSDYGYFEYALTRRGDSLIIDPGMRYRLGTVHLTVVDADGKANEYTLTAYRGRWATKDEIGRLKADIISDYHDEGYYFASLNTDQVSLDGETAELSLRLITGPMVRIERLRFKGLTRSKPEYVASLSGLRPGDPLVGDEIGDAVRRIEASEYLVNDSTPQLTPNAAYDGVELLFYLTELKSNRLELGGGYLPRQGTLPGEFVGRVDFESRNLFGSGRQLAALYDRKDRFSSRTYFRFVQPMFIPDHLEFAMNLEQVDYDSSYHSFSASGGVSLVTRGQMRLGGHASWMKTEPQHGSEPPSRTLGGGLSYEINRLGYRPNPSGGYKIGFAVSYLRRSSRPDTSATTVIDNESVFEIGADNYVPLGKAVVFRLNLAAHVRVTSRDLIDYSEQFKLGGFGSLRGYRQDQFAGRRIALGQSELRLRPSRQFALYLFSDVGYVYSKRLVAPNIVGSEEITRVGSGFGLFVGNPTVQMTMELGWGYRDRIDEGKLHIGLVTLF